MSIVTEWWDEVRKLAIAASAFSPDEVDAQIADDRAYTDKQVGTIITNDEPDNWVPGLLARIKERAYLTPRCVYCNCASRIVEGDYPAGHWWWACTSCGKKWKPLLNDHAEKIRKQLLAVYLDWTSNYKTLKKFAADYDLTETQANQLIMLGHSLLSAQKKE